MSGELPSARSFPPVHSAQHHLRQANGPPARRLHQVHTRPTRDDSTQGGTDLPPFSSQSLIDPHRFLPPLPLREQSQSSSGTQGSGMSRSSSRHSLSRSASRHSLTHSVSKHSLTHSVSKQSLTHSVSKQDLTHSSSKHSLNQGVGGGNNDGHTAGVRAREGAR
jgi:hypothetical protein